MGLRATLERDSGSGLADQLQGLQLPMEVCECASERASERDEGGASAGGYVCACLPAHESVLATGT